MGLNDLKVSLFFFFFFSPHPEAPMFLSHPHFYNADPALVDAVEGLHPSKDQHALFLDVHPVSEPAGVLSSPRGPAGWGSLPPPLSWH